MTELAGGQRGRDRRRPAPAARRGLPPIPSSLGGRSCTPEQSFCDDRWVSRRDLLHVLNALWRLSGGVPDVGVPVANIDEAIGRGHGDMRTPLDLQSLSDDGRAYRVPDGAWALTPAGFAWLAEDRALSDR